MAYQSLKDKLQQSLIAKTRVQVPDGYLFYSGATVFTTDDTVVAPYSRTDQIPLALHGKLTTYLIKQDPLVKNIVSTFVNNYNDEPVMIPKLSSLIFVPSSDKPFDPDNDTTITFTFDGSAKILWNVNIDDVKNQLVGVEKSAFEGILAGIPGVENADVVIKPFWKQAFPTDPKKINVDVISPTN